MKSIRNWEAFVGSSGSFFDANRGSPLFHLIQSLDQLYHIAHASVPFPKIGVEREEFLHKCCSRNGCALASPSGMRL